MPVGMFAFGQEGGGLGRDGWIREEKKRSPLLSFCTFATSLMEIYCSYLLAMPSGQAFTMFHHLPCWLITNSLIQGQTRWGEQENLEFPIHPIKSARRQGCEAAI